MARRVFFSFHYQRDIWRVNQVRNAEVVAKQHSTVPFYDNSIWEDSKKHGPKAVRKLIDQGLENTSVTCVLIGNETASRWWVLYEIAASLRRGNALLGVRIHNLKDKSGLTDRRGTSPFDQLYKVEQELYHKPNPFKVSQICDQGEPLQSCNHLWGQLLWASSLASKVHVYDWKEHNGYKNFSKWVENAYQTRGTL